MSQLEHIFKIKIAVNFDTPYVTVRTLFPRGKTQKSAVNKVKKFGKILSCEKYKTGGFNQHSYYYKTEFLDKKEDAIDESFTLSQALDHNHNIVIDDGITIGKTLRLQRIERNMKEKKELDEIFDEEDK